jgi:hypothetical protein
MQNFCQEKRREEDIKYALVVKKIVGSSTGSLTDLLETGAHEGDMPGAISYFIDSCACPGLDCSRQEAIRLIMKRDWQVLELL